jgi:hypothetical protein
MIFYNILCISSVFTWSCVYTLDISVLMLSVCLGGIYIYTAT